MAQRGRPRKFDTPAESAEEKPKRSGANLNMNLAPDVVEALNRFREAQRVKPTKTDTVELALQEFLSREGFYGSPGTVPQPSPVAPSTRVVRVAPISPDPFSLPFAGEIAAGIPIATFEITNEEFDFVHEFGGEDRYVLKVRGTSMTDWHITDGDYVVVRPESDAKTNDVVVAMIDEELTLKRLIRKPHITILVSCDSEKAKRTLDANEGDRIIGTLVGVLRKVQA